MSLCGVCIPETREQGVLWPQPGYSGSRSRGGCLRTSVAFSQGPALGRSREILGAFRGRLCWKEGELEWARNSAGRTLGASQNPFAHGVLSFLT